MKLHNQLLLNRAGPLFSDKWHPPIKYLVNPSTVVNNSTCVPKVGLYYGQGGVLTETFLFERDNTTEYCTCRVYPRHGDQYMEMKVGDLTDGYFQEYDILPTLVNKTRCTADQVSHYYTWDLVVSTRVSNMSYKHTMPVPGVYLSLSTYRQGRVYHYLQAL